MSIQLQFKENQEGIFMKPASNTKVYRFKIDSIELVVEEARLNPAMERAYLNQKGTLYFEGLTKFAVTENIASGVQQHRMRFQDVPLPEGIFIFALPKTALSGAFKPSTVTAKMFANHNIQDVNVVFQNMPMSIKSPSIGDIRLRPVELKQVMDHYEYPPFGVLQDPNLITLDAIGEGGERSAFPHIYIPLCPSGRETRLVPVGGDGQTINKNGDLDIGLKFTSDGAANATYLFYIFYSDVNMMLDLATQTFSPMYKRSKPN